MYIGNRLRSSPLLIIIVVIILILAEGAIALSMTLSGGVLKAALDQGPRPSLGGLVGLTGPRLRAMQSVYKKLEDPDVALTFKFQRTKETTAKAARSAMQGGHEDL